MFKYMLILNQQR